MRRAKSKKKILDIIILLPNKNPQGSKEHVIFLIAFGFGEVVTITYWLENMILYVSDIEESYIDTIIGHLINSGTAHLLLHIVQCWCACAVDEKKRDIYGSVLTRHDLCENIILVLGCPQSNTTRKENIFTIKYSTI